MIIVKPSQGGTGRIESVRIEGVAPNEKLVIKVYTFQDLGSFGVRPVMFESQTVTANDAGVATITTSSNDVGVHPIKVHGDQGTTLKTSFRTLAT